MLILTVLFLLHAWTCLASDFAMWSLNMQMEKIVVLEGANVNIVCAVECKKENNCATQNCLIKKEEINFFIKKKTEDSTSTSEEPLILSDKFVRSASHLQSKKNVHNEACISNVTLQIKEATLNDGGVYVCSCNTMSCASSSDMLLVVHSAVKELNATAETMEELVELTLGSSIEPRLINVTRLMPNREYRLGCSFRVGVGHRKSLVQMNWRQDGRTLDCRTRENLNCQKAAGNFSSKEDAFLFNAELLFTKLLISDLGPYECILHLIDMNLNSTHWMQASPTLHSRALVELKPDNSAEQSGVKLQNGTLRPKAGKSFTLECHAYGYPKPNFVKWETYGTDSLVHYENWNKTFNPLLLEHRAYYMCEVENDFGKSLIGVALRVRDPMAAVYPTVGIGLELLVLFLVIIIYERRRRNANLENQAFEENIASADGPEQQLLQH